MCAYLKCNVHLFSQIRTQENSHNVDLSLNELIVSKVGETFFFTFQVCEDALGGAEHFGAQHNGWVDDHHIQFFVSG